MKLLQLREAFSKQKSIWIHEWKGGPKKYVLLVHTYSVGKTLVSRPIIFIAPLSRYKTANIPTLCFVVALLTVREFSKRRSAFKRETAL